MQKSDRLVVAGSLAVSVLSLAVALSGGGFGRSAAVAGAPRANDLGPADGVLLSTGEGKDPLRISAADSRIAWGDRSTNRVWSVGAVDINKVMKKLLEGTSYVEKRKEAQDAAQAEEAEFNKRLEEIKTKYPLAGDGTPPPMEAQQAVAQLQQDYGKWLEGTRAKAEKLSSEQYEQAYRELVAAVETVSEKESIDLVYRFYPTSEPFEAERIGDAITQIQARTFLKYPTSIDITAEVMKTLNLSE
jgi:hypothetical protein